MCVMYVCDVCVIYNRNITAGRHQQIQHVLDANAIPILCSLLDTDEHAVRKEAAWAIGKTLVLL